MLLTQSRSLRCPSTAQGCLRPSYDRRCSTPPIAHSIVLCRADRDPTPCRDVNRFPCPASLLLASPFTSLLLTPSVSAVELNASVSRGSYYVTLGLFAMTIPGLWSLIQRTTKPTLKRRTFSVPGPAADQGIPLDQRAKDITAYFVNYNYRVDSMSDVITFVGNFQSSIGTASQLVLYTFICLACAALVLSVQFPEIGNWWYLLTLISPSAGWYYWTRAPDEEEVKIKIVTSEDDKETEIIIEGDGEELDRFGKELKLQEKGKVYVKGILER